MWSCGQTEWKGLELTLVPPSESEILLVVLVYRNCKVCILQIGSCHPVSLLQEVSHNVHPLHFEILCFYKPVQRTKVDHWPVLALYLWHQEQCLIKSLIHLSWRDFDNSSLVYKDLHLLVNKLFLILLCNCHVLGGGIWQRIFSSSSLYPATVSRTH